MMHTLIWLVFLAMTTSALKMKTTPQFISGLSEISDRYDAYIIDQWGVLHNGKELYKGTLETMLHLRNHDKKCIMLSNSSKRKENSVKGLNKVGLDPSIFFDEVVTSGEIAWEAIKERSNVIFSRQEVDKSDKLKVFVFGNNQDDDEYCHTCNCTFAINNLAYEDAEVLMKEIDSYLHVLGSRKVPMLVSNPDFYRPGPIKSPMPGLISERYIQILRQMELNEVDIDDMIYSYGKPFVDVYNRCFSILESLGVNSKDKVCGIGDSIEHDVAGANKYGISSVFIENGVHSSDFGTLEGDVNRGDISKLHNFICKEAERDNLLNPIYTIPSFSK